MSWVDSGGNVYITSGNVGIGTSTPDASLDVEIGSNAEVLRLTRTAEDPAVLRFGFDSGSGYPYLQADRFTFNPQPLLLNPDGAQVGIGLVPSFESGYALLQVGGDVQVKGLAATSGTQTRNSRQMRLTGAYWNGTVSVPLDASLQAVVSATTPTARLAIAVGASGEMVSLKNNGNVGIGVTDPTVKLQAAGDVEAVAGNIGLGTGKRLYFNGIGGSRYIQDDGDVINGLSLSLSTTFRMNNQSLLDAYQIRGRDDKWVLGYDGKVGIGKVPAVALDVVGDVQATGALGLQAKQKLHFNGMSGDKFMYMNPDAEDPEFTEGRIAFSYNLFIKRDKPGDDLFTDPPQMWIGKNRDDYLYIVIQETAASSGKWQAALQTARRPAAGAVDKGYGFHPLRVWGKNFQAGLGGHHVTGSDPSAGTFAQQIYFQKTLHVDIADGVAYYPDHYTAGRPYKTSDDSYELGGVTYNDKTGALGVRIYRDATKITANNWSLGNDLMLEDITNGALALGKLVRSTTSKVKIVFGETGTLSFNGGTPPEQEKDFGTVSIPSSPFSSIPKVFLTAENLQNSWGVSLQANAVSETDFGIIGRQNWDGASYPVQFTAQWVAIGT